MAVRLTEWLLLNFGSLLYWWSASQLFWPRLSCAFPSHFLCKIPTFLLLWLGQVNTCHLCSLSLSLFPENRGQRPLRSVRVLLLAWVKRLANLQSWHDPQKLLMRLDVGGIIVLCPASTLHMSPPADYCPKTRPLPYNTRNDAPYHRPEAVTAGGAKLLVRHRCHIFLKILDIKNEWLIDVSSRSGEYATCVGWRQVLYQVSIQMSWKCPKKGEYCVVSVSLTNWADYQLLCGW